MKNGTNKKKLGGIEMITKTISQENLKAHFEDKETLEMVETKTEKIEVTKGFMGERTYEEQIIYEVEGLGKILVYVMGKGWVLKDNYNAKEEITLKEHFNKEEFEQEQIEKEEKNQTAKELKEMSTEQLLQVCGGYEVLKKLLNREMEEHEAVGEYNYKGLPVFRITNDEHGITYWLYFAGN